MEYEHRSTIIRLTPRRGRGRRATARFWGVTPPERNWIDTIETALIQFGAWILDGLATGGLAMYPMFWDGLDDKGNPWQRLIDTKAQPRPASPSETAAARWGLTQPSFLARRLLTTRREAQRRQSIAALEALMRLPALALEPHGAGPDRPTAFRSRS